MRADYGGPYKARPRERVENEVRLDAGYCGDMRPLDENKRSVVRGLEAQSFWRAEREQNFLEPCQGALATQRSISTDQARHAQENELKTKFDWMRATAETCALLTRTSEA